MMERKAVFALTLLLICIFAGASGQICWKHAMSNMDQINSFDELLQPKTILNIITDKYILVGLILYGSAFIFWLGAMSTLDISFMYPMLSLAYVLTAVMAFIFIGENITSLRWMGILLVMIGCFLIARS